MIQDIIEVHPLKTRSQTYNRVVGADSELVDPLPVNKNIRTLILDQPGFGEWPPLRIENVVLKRVTILRALDTYAVACGSNTHDGVAQHASDLHND